MKLSKMSMLDGLRWVAQKRISQERISQERTWKENLRSRQESINQELDALKLDLQKYEYDSKKTAEFISELNPHCFLMAIDLSLGKLNKRYIRRQEKGMLTAVKKVIKRLEDKYLSIFRSRKIPGFSPSYKYLNYNELRKSLSRASEYRCIYNLEKKLSGKLSERLPGDISISKVEFVIEIALLFEKHLDKPTIYIGGPFIAAVSRALAAVGLPSEDPTRIARKALKIIERDRRAPE